MKTIIGLVGVKTSGKTTICNMIKEFVTAKEVALADKLKNTCGEIFGLERIQFDLQELKELPFKKPILLTSNHISKILTSYGIEMSFLEIDRKYSSLINMELDTPRKIAQIIGTEVLRAVGNENIHCENIKISKDEITIISDIRFPNEMEYFKNLNNIKFLPLYINRLEAEKHVTEYSHPSEKSIFEFSNKCIKIDNNGTLDETRLQIKEILEYYFIIM